MYYYYYYYCYALNFFLFCCESVNELGEGVAQYNPHSIRTRLNTASTSAGLTKVEDQFQVVFEEHRGVRALQANGEGLTPAYNQMLPVDLPGAVSQVVFVASQININNQS